MTQRIADASAALNDRPFQGEGVSLYAAGREALVYRRLRVLGLDNGRGRLDWIKGTAGVHNIAAASVLKTARVASGADPATSIDYALPAELAGVALNGVTTGAAGAGAFQVAGDVSAWLAVGETLLIAGSTANDGFYTVRAALSYAGGNTTIPVAEAVGDATVDGDLAREVVFDVRKYLDDHENQSDNYRTRTAWLDSARAEVAVILGRAALLDVQVRAAGVCRLRFVYIPETRAGVQATTFRAIATSGPTSPADGTTTATPTARTIIEIDTPELDDAGAYVYTLQAENGATVKQLLTGIAVTPDAAGPPAPTAGSTAAW